MPLINFDEVEDAQDFSPLPDGKHLCRVAEVDPAWTRNGDEMWKMQFVVDSGTFRGRRIFDNLVFSHAAMKRVKLICARLGIDVSGEVKLTPDMLKGRLCYVTVETEEYEDLAGRTKRRNVVPYAGYERADGMPAAVTHPDGNGGGSVEDDSEDSLPF